MEDLKKNLKDLENGRSIKMIELGEIKYSEIRGKEVDNKEIKEKIENLVKIDKEIYRIRSKIEEILLEEEKICIECKNRVGKDDKFCNSCGSPIESLEEKKIHEECAVCKNDIFKGDKYCGSCGVEI